MSQQINGSQIVVGTPGDSTFGVTKNVPGVNATDKLPDVIDKLISVIDKLSPSKSPDISTKFLAPLITLQSARHTASASGVTSIISNSSGNQLYSGGVWLQASAGSVYNNISTSSKAIFIISDSTSVSTLATFSDGQSGSISTLVDGILTGSRILDSGYYTQSQGGSPDIGTWDAFGSSNPSGGLSILYDGDPYTQPPNVGFWTSIKASMSSTQSFSEDGREHYYQMFSNYGLSSQLNAKGLDGLGGQQSGFYFIYSTGSGTPPILLNTYNAISITQSVTSYNSGIPSLSVGDYILASYSIINNGNLISRFYNSNGITNFQMIASSSSPIKNDMTGGLPINGISIPTSYQSTYIVSGMSASVISGMYSTNSTFSINTFGPYGLSSIVSNGTTGIGYWGQSGKYLYIDTVGSEVLINRIWSGTYSYPSFTGSNTYSQFFGPTYTYTTQQFNLNNIGNEELQYVGGIFKYPSGNYLNNYPISGFDYSSVPSGSFGGYRWVTFNVGSVVGAQSLNISINGANALLNSASVNNGTGRYINNFYMYIKIVGSGGTSWFDANLDSVSLPVNDGDGCLVKFGSSAIYRKINFGSSAKTGTVYVRIGLISSPGYQFNGLTLS